MQNTHHLLCFSIFYVIIILQFSCNNLFVFIKGGENITYTKRGLLVLLTLSMLTLCPTNVEGISIREINTNCTSSSAKVSTASQVEEILDIFESVQQTSKKEEKQKTKKKKKKNQKKKKSSYSKEDLALLARLINAENGTELPNEWMTTALELYTGQVVLNRLKRQYRGAKTLEQVVYCPGQYTSTENSCWDNPVTKRSKKNAKVLLQGTSYSEKFQIAKMPDNVIYQAAYPQGSGIWLELNGVYFCYE